MDVAIRDIGGFDVVLTDVSEQDALKAIAASNTPKVKGAFQAALDAARQEAERVSRYRVVEADTGIELYDRAGKLQATIKRYNRGNGAMFHQAYLRCTGESIRRASRGKAVSAAVNAMIAWEDRLTKVDPAEDLL